MGDVEIQLEDLPSTPRQQSPRVINPAAYVLPVDTLPSTPAYFSSSTLVPHGGQSLDVDTGMRRYSAEEELPRYVPQEETEPATLAKWLWTWGWLCPILWAIGLCM